MKNSERITVTSRAFENNQAMPEQYTGFGEDRSPDLILSAISEGAVSIAVTMDDLDIPFIPKYNHWLMWNLPVMQEIPENIPHGASLTLWPLARQGIGYGKHSYRGPKPPRFIRNTHRYIFEVYVLDCLLELEVTAKKRELLAAIDGHLLQYGSITGLWCNGFLK